MEENKILLLVQLINNLAENYNHLEKAYDSSDKENFDNSKKIILELQNKIDLLLSQTSKNNAT